MKPFEETTQSPRSIVTLDQGAYLHTSSAGAWVPFQRAIISGVIAGVTALVIMVKVQPEEWWFIPLLITVLTIGATWTVFQFQWSRLVGLIEMAVNRDLDGSGYIGDNSASEAREVEETVLINMRDTTDGGDVTRRERLPISPDKLRILADGVIAYHRPLTLREWTGKGKTFGDVEYRTIMDALEHAGIIIPKNPNERKQGFELTRAGKAVFRHYATPLPDLPEGYKYV